HYATQASDSTHDPVHYANGEVTRHLNLFVIPTSQDFRGLLPLQISPDFALTPGQAAWLTVSQGGWVQIQEFVSGTLFIPLQFQATCSAGLLTGIVGSASYPISFTTVTASGPP